jgi:hypothetical protein
MGNITVLKKLGKGKIPKLVGNQTPVMKYRAIQKEGNTSTCL